MRKLDPRKLSVEYRDGVTPTTPIFPRLYTLTHSDSTAELFLTIGLSYAFDKINTIRDEVLAEWIKKENQVFCNVYLYIDGQLGNYELASKRNEIFRRELPLALEAIRFGDSSFFSAHPVLDRTPIFVFFMSAYPQLNKVENWGTFLEYDITNK